MRPHPRVFAPAAVAAIFLALGSARVSASGADEALALVPTDVASIGVIHLDALRSSPFAARLFSVPSRRA